MQKKSFLNNILVLFHAITKKRGAGAFKLQKQCKKNTIKLPHLACVLYIKVLKKALHKV